MEQEQAPPPQRDGKGKQPLAQLLHEGSKRIWGGWSSLLAEDGALGLISGPGVSVHTNTDTEAPIVFSWTNPAHDSACLPSSPIKARLGTASCLKQTTFRGKPSVCRHTEEIFQQSDHRNCLSNSSAANSFLSNKRVSWEGE